ncbi:MAG: PT domain-containing protein [Clostridia bacterium]|nr:PT domain-containing protein [Clostridia bacterium]
MNGDDFLDKINEIDGDLVEGAENAHSRRRAIWFAAAACAALGIGVAIAAHFIGQRGKAPDVYAESLPTRQLESARPTAALTAAPTEAPTAEPTPVPQILYASGEYIHEFIPGHGGINMSAGLSREIQNEENDGCLFAVDISLAGISDDLWAQYDAEQRQIHDGEYWPKYQYAFDDWQQEKFPFWSGEEIAAYYGYDVDTFYNQKERGIWIGYWIMTADFEEYFKTVVSDEEFRLCVEANNRYNEIENEKYGDCTEIKERTREAIEAEYERLLSLGFWVELSDASAYSYSCGYSLIGYLTAEQLREFPVNDDYGYYIFWIGHADAIAE